MFEVFFLILGLFMMAFARYFFSGYDGSPLSVTIPKCPLVFVF